MRKKEALEHWVNLKANQDILPTPVVYKHKGSTYDEDGIRITGSKAFIDSVLSHLKQVLAYESNTTRLQIVFKETVDRETGVETGKYNCYVQVHERGSEAKMVNTAFNLYGR
jgi:hypothetical protein